jgi:hypothetical protein
MRNKIWFERELEKSITQTIDNCYPAGWQENSISEAILKTLKKFFDEFKYYDPLTGLTKIEFVAYKLSGKPETDFGDIALLTTIRFDNGKKLKGVANFEAKKRLPDTFNYRGQSRDTQYTTICRNTPYAQLLLYDFEPITQHIRPIVGIEYAEEYHQVQYGHFTHAKCTNLPLYMVAGEGNVSRNHLRHSRILTEQLCRRIFYGVDLHYSDDIVNAILNFDTQHHPMFVATIAVTHGNTEITDDRDRFDIPERLYTRIE